jgi:hypothetical protein
MNSKPNDEESVDLPPVIGASAPTLPTAKGPDPIIQLENTAPVQLIKCEDRKWPSIQSLVDSVHAKETILGIFTSNKPFILTLPIIGESFEAINLKSSKYGKYGGKSKIWLQIGLFLLLAVILTSFMSEEQIEVAGVVGGGIMGLIIGVRKILIGEKSLPDLLVITAQDLVVLCGIRYNKKTGLHYFSKGIRILREHADIKFASLKSIYINVYGDKGLLGNRKKDVEVRLRQSSKALKKEKALFGEQLVDYQQAKTMLG